MNTPVTSNNHQRLDSNQADPTLIDVGVTRALARKAVYLTAADVDKRAWTMARHCLLDWFGVTLAGANEPCARIVTEEAMAQSGSMESSLVAPKSARLHPALAALANGTAAHALDYDDVLYALHGHATAAIAPAVVALAEARGRSLEQTMLALIAGVEVAAQAATYVGGEHYSIGWHSTSTLGGLGAAAGAALIVGLDETQTAHAIGLAVTQSAGMRSMFGTMAKPLHAGRAARTGVEAALLVERGFETRDDALECEQGLADVMHGTPHDKRHDLATLGRRSGGLHIEDSLFKYHASCFETHATIEACNELKVTAALEPSTITDVTIRVRKANLKICNIENPVTGLQAKFSLRQTAAMALAGIDTGDIASFSDRGCDDPAIKTLMTRIVVRADDSLRRAQVVVNIKRNAASPGTDSETIKKFYDASVAETDLDLQETRLVKKFDRLATAAGTGAERIKHLLLRQEPSATNLADLVAHLAN